MVLDCDENLKSGYSVEVILMPEEEKEYFTLPYEAICRMKKIPNMFGSFKMAGQSERIL